MLALISLLTVAATVMHPIPQPAITLHYYERPPFYTGTVDGGVEGLVATPALRALSTARISYTIRSTPPKRQLAIIKQNIEPACMIGWLRTIEREKVGNFSSVLYRDRRPVAIARADNVALRSDRTLSATIGDSTLTILIKEGFSYGPKADAEIRNHPVPMRTTAQTAEMLKMIFYRRADYFLLSQEEADELIARSSFRRQDFRYIFFSDMKSGIERRLWCTKQVDVAQMRALNAAIAQLRGQAQ